MIFLPLGTELKPKRIPKVTLGIIAINTLVYFYLNSLDQEGLNQAFSLYTWQNLDGNLGPLITSLFFHYSPYHLVGNMIYLWTFGAYLETVIGGKRYLFYYLVGGIAGGCFMEVVILYLLPEYREGYAYGASGAISALMGVSLVRCYYNKIKLGVDPLGLFTFIPKRFAVPSFLFIGYSALLDWIWCSRSFDNTYFYPWLGCWDHVGGFLFGAGASLYFRDYRQAHLDHCRLRADYWLKKGMGLDQVRQDLQTIVQRDPQDAWAMVDLARVEAKYEQREKGLELYRRAILTFWKQGERQGAAMIFAEFFRKYCPVTFGLLPFSLCRELIRMGEPEIAARALEQFIEERKGRAKGRYAFRLETAYWLLAELLGEKLSQPRLAGKVWRASLGRFPGSGYREVAEKKLSLMAQNASA